MNDSLFPDLFAAFEPAPPDPLVLADQDGPRRFATAGAFGEVGVGGAGLGHAVDPSPGRAIAHQLGDKESGVDRWGGGHGASLGREDPPAGGEGTSSGGRNVQPREDNRLRLGLIAHAGR